METKKPRRPWRASDELWARIEPLLPPGTPHPVGCHRPGWIIAGPSIGVACTAQCPPLVLPAVVRSHAMIARRFSLARVTRADLTASSAEFPTLICRDPKGLAC